ncbi:MAG TPA: hypothetical protein VLV86_00385 [Vicinamibacterales bacterium]|nr:hypothetical protein [Vicinamibacterales bacterium]
MTNVLDVWSRRSDDQVLDAAQRLTEYSAEAQDAILREITQRGLVIPPVVSDSVPPQFAQNMAGHPPASLAYWLTMALTDESEFSAIKRGRRLIALESSLTAVVALLVVAPLRLGPLVVIGLFLLRLGLWFEASKRGRGSPVSVLGSLRMASAFALFITPWIGFSVMKQFDRTITYAAQDYPILDTVLLGGFLGLGALARFVHTQYDRESLFYPAETTTVENERA